MDETKILGICVEHCGSYSGLVDALADYHGDKLSRAMFDVIIDRTKSFCVAAALLHLRRRLAVHDIVKLYACTPPMDVVHYMRHLFDDGDVDDQDRALAAFVAVCAHLARQGDAPAMDVVARLWVDDRVPSVDDFYASLAAALKVSGTVWGSGLAYAVRRLPVSERRSSALAALDRVTAPPASPRPLFGGDARQAAFLAAIATQATPDDHLRRVTRALTSEDVKSIHLPTPTAPHSLKIVLECNVRTKPLVTADVLMGAWNTFPDQRHLLVGIARQRPAHASGVVVLLIKRMAQSVDVWSLVDLMQAVWEFNGTLPKYGALVHLRRVLADVLQVLGSFSSNFQAELLYALAPVAGPDVGDLVAHLGDAHAAVVCEIASMPRLLHDVTEVLDAVGTGTFSTVFANSARTFVVKEMGHRRQELDEIAILRRVDGIAQTHLAVRRCTMRMLHAHARFTSAVGQGVGVQLEYGGTACAALTPMNLAVDVATTALCEFALALHVLNGNGIFHNDMKDDNVLYDAASNRFVVIDFGFSTPAYQQKVFEYAYVKTGSAITTWMLWHPWYQYVLFKLRAEGATVIDGSSLGAAKSHGASFVAEFLATFFMPLASTFDINVLDTVIDGLFAKNDGARIVDLLCECVRFNDAYGAGVFAAIVLAEDVVPQQQALARDVVAKYLFASFTHSALDLIRLLQPRGAVVGAPTVVDVDAACACLFPMGDRVLKVFNTTDTYRRETGLYDGVRAIEPQLVPPVVAVHTALRLGDLARSKCPGLAEHDDACGVELGTGGAVALARCMQTFDVDVAQAAIVNFLNRVAAVNDAGLFNLAISPDTVFVAADGALSLPQWTCGTADPAQFGRRRLTQWMPWQLQLSAGPGFMAGVFREVLAKEPAPEDLAAAHAEATTMAAPPWWQYTDVYAAVLVSAYMLRRYTADMECAPRLVQHVLTRAAPVPVAELVRLASPPGPPRTKKGRHGDKLDMW